MNFNFNIVKMQEEYLKRTIDRIKILTGHTSYNSIIFLTHLDIIQKGLAAAKKVQITE